MIDRFIDTLDLSSVDIDLYNQIQRFREDYKQSSKNRNIDQTINHVQMIDSDTVVILRSKYYLAIAACVVRESLVDVFVKSAHSSSEYIYAHGDGHRIEEYCFLGFEEARKETRDGIIRVVVRYRVPEGYNSWEETFTFKQNDENSGC